MVQATARPLFKGAARVEDAGLDAEEPMARPFREFVHPDDVPGTSLHADALDRQPGEVLDFENRYRARDGSYRWPSWRARSDGERKYAIARARRHGHPLALALIDLDRFKRYNDAHGHPAGDALLAQAATSWRASLRVTDFLARYGGEEFAVLLPDCPPGEVSGLLERVRAATPGDQTVSLGVAHWERR